jgi:hypothetical protein
MVIPDTDMEGPQCPFPTGSQPRCGWRAHTAGAMRRHLQEKHSTAPLGKDHIHTVSNYGIELCKQCHTWCIDKLLDSTEQFNGASSWSRHRCSEPNTQQFAPSPSPPSSIAIKNTVPQASLSGVAASKAAKNSLTQTPPCNANPLDPALAPFLQSLEHMPWLLQVIADGRCSVASVLLALRIISDAHVGDDADKAIIDRTRRSLGASMKSAWTELEWVQQVPIELRGAHFDPYRQCCQAGVLARPARTPGRAGGARPGKWSGGE